MSSTDTKGFEPIGGYPPLIRLADDIDEKKIETRSFENSNIVNIKNIINTKKKDVFIKFGMSEEDGFNKSDQHLRDYLTFTAPREYDDIEYDSS